MRQRTYCGNQPQVPVGYDRVGTPYQCLRKGYGVCLYSGRLGENRRENVSAAGIWITRILLIVGIVAIIGLFLAFLIAIFVLVVKKS